MYYDDPNKCASCGKTYPYEVRFHSGSRECQVCWDWRKLNAPMAYYWNERIYALLEQGPDMYDYQVWARMGITEEMEEALLTLNAFAVRMEIAINTDGNDRRIALGYTPLEGE